MKTLLILATVFTTSISTVFANDIAKLQVKPAAEVVNTLNKKGKKIVKKNSEDLNIYMAVMDMYAKDPANFYNLDEATKAKFFAAAENLNKSLLSSKKKDVRELAEQVAFNQAVSNYIWNLKKSSAYVLPVVDATVQQTSL